MDRELYKRINTGLLLLLILILMFMSKIIYLFVLISIFSLSFVEFTKLSKIFLKKKYVYQFLVNAVFALYLFLFY